MTVETPDQTIVEDVIMTPNEVAIMLRVSRRTLIRWHDNKSLVANKIGGRIYYLRSEIYETLKSGKDEKG